MTDINERLARYHVRAVELREFAESVQNSHLSPHLKLAISHVVLALATAMTNEQCDLVDEVADTDRDIANAARAAIRKAAA